MARRFHIPILGIAALVFAIIVLFFFFSIGEEEEKELPEKIDIFLYDNLGLVPDVHEISGSMQVYSRDELVQSARAEALLKQNKANPLLADLKLSSAVEGFQKRATVFDVIGTGKGIEKRTLVELRFQANHDADVLKIIESIPKTTAVSGELLLTQGGVIAEKDPILVFTFNDVRAEKTLKAVYVIGKEISNLETLTFAAEETGKAAKPAAEKVCGDGKCVEGESYMSCCQDCGCLPGFVCDNNLCVAAEKDECRRDADCDDGDVSTSDACSGSPKTCRHTAITECIGGDEYCPEGCGHEEDADCEQIEEVDVTELDITGEQESPDISDVTITPGNVSIGGEILIEAKVIDANGKDDIARVWFEVLELAQTHGETGEMNDAGRDGDRTANDDIYTGNNEIEEYYLAGFYHITVFAQDMAGNKKKSQSTFRVIETGSENEE